MRVLLSLVALTLSLGAATARAESPMSSPLFGTWEVEVARLPILEDARPQRVTITFSQMENGDVSTLVEVIDASGARLHATGTSALDGTPARVTGNLEADDSATTMPASNVLVMQLAKGGVPASTRVYVVSNDGATMIETSAYVGGEGRPVLRTNYFKRVDLHEQSGEW